MPDRLNRRTFLKQLLIVSAAGAGLGVSGCSKRGATKATPTVAAASARPPAVTSAPASPTSAPPPPTSAATALATSAPPPARTSVPDTATPVPATATALPKSTSASVGAGSTYLAVARGANAAPSELVRRAVGALGGFERFVKKGADVIVKPNICNAYNGPEYASTTNPQVVAAIVTLCLGAGAKRVRVMDFPFGGTPQASYQTSRIADTVKAAGGEMEVMSGMRWRDVSIPQGKTLKQWTIYGDILDADVVINVPIAKDHGSTRLTLGMKNLMGVVQDRTGMHARGLHQTIADIHSVVRPQLTIVDAVRILVANGPTGGNLNDVKKIDTVIASADTVAADAYATTLFDLKPADIGYIRAGAEMGLGQMDLKAIRIEEITI